MKSYSDVERKGPRIAKTLGNPTLDIAAMKKGVTCNSTNASQKQNDKQKKAHIKYVY